MTETEQADSVTWHLDAEDIAPTMARLEKINERARRQGLAGRYSYRLGETHREPVFDDDARMVIDGVPHRLEHGNPVPCQLIYTKQTTEFIVEGTAPKIAGWTFLATLTWENGGTLVTRTAPGFEGRIDPWSVRPQWCDHCKKIRGRYDTYLLEHDGGERKQVGSSCIKDFLGHPFHPSWLSGHRDLDEISESFGTRGCREADTDSVLAWAAALTEKTGWISRQKAETEYRAASSDTLQGLLFGNSRAERALRTELAPTDGRRATAARVRQWARGVDDSSSEYLANVRRLAGAEFITPRNAGIIGSAVAAYHREMTAKAEREARPVSQWMGQPKDKITVQATVRSDTPVDGDWGVRHRYGFLTQEGNWVIWWASSDQRLAVGREVTLSGTVKGHEEYREVKSTVLTRCKISGPQREMEAAS